MYETITEIKDVDSGGMISINNHERNEYAQKDYSSVEQLYEVVTKQMDYLDRQIEQYQIQQQNLIENYNKVIDDIDSRQLLKDKQEEVEEEYEPC